ncbi:D-arabinose 5-phosphate isomerase [hydrothermal vent metagenome]|uniref:D-arabinose 5-phosphate isomerase n=1 Tax=hydrothermal vent metagenome TaxID=652676 RepID=A0A3B0RZY7_9ZZZZ
MTKPPKNAELLSLAKSVIQSEANALAQLADNLTDDFAQATRLIHSTNGHCIVSGVGKSGHIGRKIAATFSSTGTPSFFIHPTEASHGDLGMIGADACVLAISNSGETRELRDLIVHCREQKIPLIAITRNPDSFLSKHADVTLVLPVADEACPNGLAPTTSTTMTLALGDALAIASMRLNGFSREDFGQRHPGGTLGLSLQKVSSYLLENTDPVPMVSKTATGKEVVQAITEGRQGCIAVIDQGGRFCGMITDGDLRRAMEQDFFDKTAAQIMTGKPATAVPNQRMKELIHIMTTRRIANLFVIEDGKPVGLVHIKDLMQRGFV